MQTRRFAVAKELSNAARWLSEAGQVSAQLNRAVYEADARAKQAEQALEALRRGVRGRAAAATVVGR